MYSRVTYESKFFLDSSGSTGPKGNDTIVKEQVFDNYLAYDDGTAEKSYYLNLFTSLPGIIEIEFHLNQPDTLRGLAIYFGRQIPFANYKPFYINIYSALKNVNLAPADILLSTSSAQSPAYADSINHFWIYTLDTPLVLPAGIFYAGTMQSDADGSDSIYYGLDVNRIGWNHAYYNVEGHWVASGIAGAIMMRPMLGKYVSNSKVPGFPVSSDDWDVMPNPAGDNLRLRFVSDQPADYIIRDITGQNVLNGHVLTGKPIDISMLQPGMYFVSISQQGVAAAPKKLIKL